MMYFVVGRKIGGFKLIKRFVTYKEASSYRRDEELILREACYCDMGDEPCEDHVEL